MTNMICGTFLAMLRRLVPRVNRRACQRLLKDLTRNPFFREIVGVAPGTRPEDVSNKRDDTLSPPGIFFILLLVNDRRTTRLQGHLHTLISL